MYLIISTDKNSHFSISFIVKKVEKVVTVRKPFKQTELLLKKIAALVDLKKIKGIIVNQGPGEFSALRIGIATANALSYSLDIPLVGVLTKDLLEVTEREKINFLWAKGQVELKKNKGTKIILPFYDKEPNITKGEK
jgi:tRNA A37 threonylcarbamoyladenosine modification protein TsaB